MSPRYRQRHSVRRSGCWRAVARWRWWAATGRFPAFNLRHRAQSQTIRGSIVGTRMDLIEALRFAAEGKVASHYSMDRLENVNGIFDRMRAGTIEGRVVMAI